MDKREIQKIPLPEFWFYSHQEGKYYCFQKYDFFTKPHGENYRLMKCLEEDLTEGNLKAMIADGVGRI